MELVITPATEADADNIAKVLTDAVDFKVKHGDMVWGTGLYTQEEVLGMMSGGNLYKATLDNKIVGNFILQWEDLKVWGEQPPNAGYIHQLAISKNSHGKDLGEQMIEWAAAEASKKGRQFLRLDCPAANTELCKYYEGKGFRLVATKPNPFHENSLTSYYERKLEAS